MEEKERFAWLTFNPHTVALCPLSASSRAPAHPCIRIHTYTVARSFPPPPPPQRPRPPVPARPAWVSAKEDTWQDRYTQGCPDPPDLTRMRGRKGGRQVIQCTFVSKRALSMLDSFVSIFMKFNFLKLFVPQTLTVKNNNNKNISERPQTKCFLKWL